MGGILNKVKELAVSLERVSPLDWNDMLGVLLLDNLWCSTDNFIFRDFYGYMQSIKTVLIKRIAFQH